MSYYDQVPPPPGGPGPLESVSTVLVLFVAFGAMLMAILNFGDPPMFWGHFTVSAAACGYFIARNGRKR